MPHEPFQFRLRDLLVVMTVLAFLFGLLFPGIRMAREAARRERCRNNLRQIGLAMLNYHDVFKTLPFAQLPDINGKPMHSWRMSVMPFVESNPYYDQYDSHQPWDGRNNRKLHSVSVYTYQCPSDRTVSSSTVTGYTAVIGPETSWPFDKCLRLGDVTDGTNSTVLAVGTVGLGIHWMEPRDLDFSKLDFRVSSGPKRDIASKHPGGANALLADGTVRFLNRDTSPDTVRALLTRAGNEEVVIETDR